MGGQYDPTDLEARAREQAEQEKLEQQAEIREAKDLRWLMSTRQGRRVAARLMAKAGVNRSTFSTNALQMAYGEGFRNYGNWMLARILEVCPESYRELLKEQEDDERSNSGTGPNSK